MITIRLLSVSSVFTQIYELAENTRYHYAVRSCECEYPQLFLLED
jgi:hypothetical protein